MGGACAVKLFLVAFEIQPSYTRAHFPRIVMPSDSVSRHHRGCHLRRGLVAARLPARHVVVIPARGRHPFQQRASAACNSPTRYICAQFRGVFRRLLCLGGRKKHRMRGEIARKTRSNEGAGIMVHSGLVRWRLLSGNEPPFLIFQVISVALGRTWHAFSYLDFCSPGFSFSSLYFSSSLSFTPGNEFFVVPPHVRLSSYQI